MIIIKYADIVKKHLILLSPVVMKLFDNNIIILIKAIVSHYNFNNNDLGNTRRQSYDKRLLNLLDT